RPSSRSYLSELVPVLLLSSPSSLSSLVSPPPTATVGVTAPSGAPVLHDTGCDAGEPAARMSRPWSPPRLNLIGIARPALSEFTLGKLRTGGKKPAKV